MKTLTVGQRSFEKLIQYTMLNKVQTLLLVKLLLLLKELKCFSLSHEWGDSAES
jgi:hypothetical protein